MGEMTAGVFWERFLHVVPEFIDAYQQELDDEFGELLPHLMMSITLLPFLEVQVEAASNAPNMHARQVANDVVRRALTSLEEGLAGGDNEVQDTILLSFLENLGKQDREEVQNQFRAFFGPYLESGMKAVERWLDQPWWEDRSAPYERLIWNRAGVRDQRTDAR